ncbi:unnamed protein product [Sphagnum troendelagicum]
MVMCKAVPPMDPAALAAVPLIQQQPDQLDPFNVPTTTSLSLLQNNAMSSSSGHDDIQPDVSEIYFLVMHFLASGPCSRAFGQLWNELLQHKLLPRRFHAWVSRDGKQSNDENDDGASFPLSYRDVEARYPNIEKTHLVKLLQQLLIHDRRLVATMEPPQSRIPTAADAPTLLGSGAFSLLDSERSKAPKEVSLWTRQMRWPHWQADQVHGLMLRELGGGFARHSRAPTSQTACYVVLKPDILVDRIQIIKKLRGHRNAVYCAIFDRTGQYVITGSDDRLVKIWSSETGLCLRSCRGHEGDITDMAVSSGNTLVASASNDCSIRIWRLPDGVPISVLRGHTSSVTTITFSPRQGCEHLLLSTSDDGTCRIWDALDSSRKSRVYMPSPKEPPTNVKGPGVPPPPAPPIINQVICCAFNADGSIFVTGSSDKIARVWDACKWNDDVTGRPNHELDTLRGHEHDVNYVQFSGCAAPARPLVSDVVKKDYPSQFKNSWFGHASIVTCSRDGSAIIWTPRPRKYHGKVGRWVKAYHLRVPPPPMPPPAPRGNGPRQRLLPTPRGVNMIVWSLDNRFVLAAIMDHRICVWNAVDGSLVHSLTGHDKQTYVLDVHPFNPRIAMSAGYDGRVIIWDIWEGHPIKVYETGEYNLVDGHFSPDGSSLVVSDEVGQIYVFGTGPEMSQKDVKYDQFFLGDFRPLVRDAFGNVLDVETQLAPHVRNIQDLLCDASLIPYPEPYQSTYQQRRLGTLGINWTPPSVHLAIGATDDAVYIRHVDPPIAVLRPPERHDRQGILTGVGGNRWVEQPSEVGEAMDWEQEVVAGGGLSEDTGSNYSASEESQSDEEEAGHSGDSLDDEGLGSSDAEEGVEEQDGKTNLRRSCRNKRKLEEYIHTASGRRVRRQTLKDNNESSERGQRHRPSRAPRPGTSTACITTHQASSSRPRRLAARNALNLFSSMNSNEEAENNNPVVAASSPAAAHEDGPQALDSENRLGISAAASPLKSCAHNGDVLVKENGHENNLGHRVNKELDFIETQNHPEDGKSKSETCVENKGLEASYFAELPTWSMGNRRTLGRPQYSKFVVCDVEDDLLQTATDVEAGIAETLEGEAQSHQQEDEQDHLCDGQNKNMDFKKASSEYTDDGTADTGCQANKNSQDMDVHNRNNILEESVVHVAASTEELLQAKDSDTEQELSVKSVLPNSDEEQVDAEEHHESCLALQERAPTLHVTRSQVIVDKPSSSRIRHHQPTRLIPEWEAMGDEPNHGDDQEEGDKGTSRSDLCDDTCPSTQDWSDSGEQDTADESAEVSQGRHHTQRHHQALGKLGSYTGQASTSERRQHLNNLETSPRTRRVRRMPSALDENHCETRSRGNHEQPTQAISGAESTPGASSMWGEEKEILIKDGSKSWQNGSTSARCLRPRQPANNMDATLSGSDIERPSWTEPRSSRVAPKEEGKESSFECDHRLEYYGNEKAWHLTGHQRQNVSHREKGMARQGDFGTWGQRGGRRSRKFATRSRTLDTVAWLLTEEVELGTRFIPQFGDEVVYLRQGHQEFLQKAKLDEKGPWRILKKPVGAVEFCRIISLDYVIEKPSQKTSCKLELQFTDVSSEVYGKTFKLTLLELTDHPDFLVERTRYDTSMNKGWRARDHCQVWWACEENGKAGSWWEGRIKLLKPKSPEFPESPWEMYHVMYKGSSAEPTAHSPWELFEKNYNLEDWQLPSIDEPQKESLKTIFDKLQYNANEFGLEKLQEDMYNIEYINRIALPLSFDTISARVERDYYHSVQAFEHDVKLMVSNAQTFYGNDTMEADRIEELADELLGALQ